MKAGCLKHLGSGNCLDEGLCVLDGRECPSSTGPCEVKLPSPLMYLICHLADYSFKSLTMDIIGASLSFVEEFEVHSVWQLFVCLVCIKSLF